MTAVSTPSIHSSDEARDDRCSLLARADASSLLELADRCLDAAAAADLELLHAPEIGMIMLTVREPVEATRFHLGEVLVTRCEVLHRGERGWAMRMGDDEAAALAAAILDAERAAEGPLAGAVDRLCAETAAAAHAAAAAEWADVAPTIVDFEEMD